MEVPTQCPTCGAKITAESQRFCTYCGVALPRAAPAVVTPEERSRARFELLRAHPRYEGLMRHEASALGIYAQTGCASIFGVIFLFVAGVLAFGSFRLGGGMQGLPGPVSLLFTLVPLLVFGFGLVFLVTTLGRGVRVAGSPLGRAPSYVVGVRTDVSGDRDRSSTSYFVTLEDEHGQRIEYPTSGTTVGQLHEGDMGVGYIRGGQLLDFKRVRV